MRKTATIHLHIDRAVGPDQAEDKILELELAKLEWKRTEKPEHATMTQFILTMVERGIAASRG